MKTTAKALFASVLITASGSALAGDTTRILHDEPYGAIVTKEAGVLVFRGLPPTRKVVVNPGGKTPVQLRHTEVNETNVVVMSQDDYVRGLGAKIVRLK
ncbi:hypothetical protein [Labrenzia sp. PHM005]|uniref:hypothetical protein n=1 Tax=Labrenzia sp. PHM005 TaxID=2590016 RepID=UPI00113FE563|nr:hypothetical protein [Labrenzia sp. PHM005]QDG75792.1 hypothetical protein FJ695_07940 [Labrenzia sp. PHM005]